MPPCALPNEFVRKPLSLEYRTVICESKFCSRAPPAVTLHVGFEAAPTEDQALHFSECTPPLYAEVGAWRLFAVFTPRLLFPASPPSDQQRVSLLQESYKCFHQESSGPLHVPLKLGCETVAAQPLDL